MKSHVHYSGFAPKSDERIAETIRGMGRSEVARIKRAMRNPESRSQRQVAELPPEFADPAIERLAVQIRNGNWEAAVEEVSRIAVEWEMWETDLLPLSQMSEGELLATHVSRLKLPTRTIGVIESLGIATLGSLLESFPGEFVELRNCGLVMVKSIAQALVRDGLLTPKKALEAIAKWEMLDYEHSTSK